ncbi:unnamed protein product [Camellia sinensis]
MKRERERERCVNFGVDSSVYRTRRISQPKMGPLSETAIRRRKFGFLYY